MLSDLQVKIAKPTDRPYRLYDSGGLYLQIHPNGSKYWRLKYRFGNKEKLLALGVYPVVGLKLARNKTMTAKRSLDEGVDPGAQKQEQKEAARKEIENTFEVVARAWHSHHRNRWADNTANNNIHRLETDVFPVIGQLAVDKLTVQDVLLPIREVEARGANELARRTLGLCSQVFRYAIVQGIVSQNPIAHIKPIDALKPAKKGHFAAIESKELPALVKAIRDNKVRLYTTTQLALELMLLTFVRTSELIQAEWDEFDLEKKVWLIPASRMKMRRDHIVPLSIRAVEILVELKSLSGPRKFVFQHFSNPRKHMSNNTILKALERLGYKGQMTGHGFRALAMSTIKEELGYRHEVIDRQLAHAHRNKVDAAYDRAQFLTERVKMMQEWASYIYEIASS
ncbi:tyrosine-type recombinase/integrase [Spirosoma sp. RP8]|uniref:Tyrosine-type recombinase/integrase n=1 Tax=Spirosoma liriopis TaxID=2937440 RepID=A0ABT0HHX8_9BACT|nr:integrase arm-type DNA-binding domain-containing protein [Spirosoma liriopis]MCK8491766.1 tyrosine-type recombinase/integrase [Spirosoma liriopis]